MKQLDWTPESLENPNESPLLGAIARFEGLNDNELHMLADCLRFAPQLKHVEDLLVTVYGPHWLPGLEMAAQRASRTKRRDRVRTGERIE